MAKNDHIEWSVKSFRILLLLQIMQSGPIPENEWIKPKFETSDLGLVTLAPTIFENEVLVDFFDFGWFDMVDIAYAYSNSAKHTWLLHLHYLPD